MFKIGDRVHSSAFGLGTVNDIDTRPHSSAGTRRLRVCFDDTDECVWFTLEGRILAGRVSNWDIEHAKPEGVALSMSDCLRDVPNEVDRRALARNVLLQITEHMTSNQLASLCDAAYNVVNETV